MTREDHLKFCKKCINRKMDLQQGLICSITNKKADFIDNCENFQRDESVKDEVPVNGRNTTEIVSELPEEIKSKLTQHQDLIYAIIGGFFISIISALIWAAITVSTEYQIGYMAIGLGILVGFGVRFFGAGIDPIFGFIGGFFALFGCLLGNLFSQVGFIADAQALGYFETLTFFDLETIIQVYQESFDIIDLGFYGIAISAGYKFAFRPIPANINELNDLTPTYSKLKLPLVVACLIILLFAGYKLSNGVSGEQIFYYDNGQKQVIANYEDGFETGLWKWYYESGVLMRSGSYKNGLFDGAWLNYNEEGILIDSSNYVLGRMDGEYKSFHANGKLSQLGKYARDRQIGEWKIFYDNGNVNATGTFKNGELSGLWKFYNYNGTPRQEINYLDKETVRILNLWDPNGNQIIENGNGTFTSFFDDTKKLQEGKVINGIKVGTWTTYYQDGSVQEVGEFVDDKYIVKSVWDKKDGLIVQNGNGNYTIFFEDSNIELEKGQFKNGLRNGTWLVYYPNSTSIQQESNYKNGKLEGRSVVYYMNGNILSEGNFIADKQVGEWKWYYESGLIQSTISYEDNRKQGEQIFWSESGKKAKKEVYENGELVSEVLL